MEDFKDVVIEGRKFRIELIPAMSASWIVAQAEARRGADEAIYRRTQSILFSACYFYKNVEGRDIKVDLFQAPDRWLIPEIAKDAFTVHVLFQEAIKFNLGPFGKKYDEWQKEKKLEEEGQSGASDTPQPDSPKT